jgi:hypothetical protein
MANGTRESLWATPVEGKVVRIENVPMGTEKFAMGDLVAVSKKGRIKRVVERRFRTRHGIRSCSVHWMELCDYLELHDIRTELLDDDVFGMTIPLEIGEKKLKKIVRKSPVPFELLDPSGFDDEDE